MIKKSLGEFSQQDIQAFFKKNAFLRSLQGESPEQLQTLLKVSEIEVYEPGELLEDKGENAKKFFILLDGRLDVYGRDQEEAIGHVLAGQLVGALAVINHQPRMANLKAVRSDASLLAVNFAAFGMLSDFSKIQLETKVCLYRSVVAFTYWKLDEYRYRSNDALLVEGLARHEDFKGEKNTIEELTFLAGASSYLGGLLDKWNKIR